MSTVGLRSLGASVDTPGRVALEVPPEEYRRLLGLPTDAEPSSAVREMLEAALDWFSLHARPWRRVLRQRIAALDPAGFALEAGVRLSAPGLARRLHAARAGEVACVAASAGAEAEVQARELWSEGRPDAAYALDRLAAAVVEHLVRKTVATTCEEEASGAFAMAAASPGCGDWPLDDQARLFGLFGDSRLRLLPSGGLAPGASQLAVIGLTPDPAHAAGPAATCARCSHPRCVYRRRSA